MGRGVEGEKVLTGVHGLAGLASSTSMLKREGVCLILPPSNCLVFLTEKMEGSTFSASKKSSSPERLVNCLLPGDLTSKVCFCFSASRRL